MPLVIEIPDEIILALRLSLERQAEELKKELAIHLYQEGLLPFGPASRLAGMPRLDFHYLLGKRHIPRHYSREDLQEDAETAANLISRLGLADVKAFGLTWEDCRDFLSRVGYHVRVEVSQVV